MFGHGLDGVVDEVGEDAFEEGFVRVNVGRGFLGDVADFYSSGDVDGGYEVFEDFLDVDLGFLWVEGSSVVLEVGDYFVNVEDLFFDALYVFSHVLFEFVVGHVFDVFFG